MILYACRILLRKTRMKLMSCDCFVQNPSCVVTYSPQNKVLWDPAVKQMAFPVAILFNTVIFHFPPPASSSHPELQSSNHPLHVSLSILLSPIPFALSAPLFPLLQMNATFEAWLKCCCLQVPPLMLPWGFSFVLLVFLLASLSHHITFSLVLKFYFKLAFLSIKTRPCVLFAFL